MLAVFKPMRESLRGGELNAAQIVEIMNAQFAPALAVGADRLVERLYVHPAMRQNQARAIRPRRHVSHHIAHMDDIHSVVDIECHGSGRPRVPGAIKIDHGVGHADHLPQGWRIFPA
jgi:hypothetical protein